MVSVADPVITRLAWSCSGCHCPGSREGVLLRVASLGKDPHSKLQVLFPLNEYHFRTIVKLKNLSGAIVSWGPPVFMRHHTEPFSEAQRTMWAV